MSALSTDKANEKEAVAHTEAQRARRFFDGQVSGFIHRLRKTAINDTMLVSRMKLLSVSRLSWSASSEQPKEGFEITTTVIIPLLAKSAGLDVFRLYDFDQSID